MFLNIPIQKLCVAPEASLQEAVRVMQNGAKQVSLVVDEGRRLLGILTDGDVRRAILQGTAMGKGVSKVMQRSFTAVSKEATLTEIFALMQAKSIRHVPVLDESGILIDLVWISDLIHHEPAELSAVVMAGGFGKRLLPLTEHLPKPMLPVGDRPVMEHIIDNLRTAGVRKVNVTTHYMPEKIRGHFGNGRKFGVQIKYISEDKPLGTAGALGLMKTPEQPMLVINGDVLTEVDYRAMLAFHRDNRADLTMGVRQYEIQVPYGVLECEGAEVRRICEKPMHRFLVNAGIYLLEPVAHQYIPKNERSDMPDLIDRLIAEGRRVVSFPIMEYWLDIGQHADYERAQTYAPQGRLSA